MKPKTSRNRQILAAFNKGITIYQLSKKYKLSWPRTKRIIQEEQAREEKQNA